MRTRLLTAFALAVLTLAAILLAAPAVTAAVFGAVLLAGGWEWSAFLAVGARWRVLYVLLLAVVGAAAYRFAHHAGGFVPLMMVGVAWWIVALLWILFTPTRAARAVAALAGALALIPTWIALVRIDARFPQGPQWTLFILALAFAADTGAFFAGRQWGRTRLAPRVSPNKTWEGVAGGLALALAVGVAAAVWFGQPLSRFLPLCVVAAAFSVVGDLTESLLKRHVHLKDSGRVFPGHGGVLDRIDSVTAATPVVALGLVWLGAGR